MNKILIVGDNTDDLNFIAHALSKKGYKTSCANNSAEALKLADLIIPHLILLDIKMPELDGYQVCKRLKTNPQTKDIPIIFISASDNISDKVKAFEVGGVDYCTKPLIIKEVLVRVKNHLAISLARARKEQFERVLEEKVTERTLELKLINQNLIATNKKLEQKILERQQTQNQLVRDALYDRLTGLPNRTLLLERIDRAIERHKREPNYLFAVLFIDLDRFKIINDSLGHLIGDKLLIAVAKLLSEDIRSVDTVARLGGDEFVILLGDISSLKDATTVGDRLQAKFKKIFNIDDRSVFTTISIGIALNSYNYQNSSEILRDADTAMYRAKEKGKARYEIFDRQMHFQTSQTLELENDLRLALANQEFSLCYQPIVALDDRSLLGFEALIRWQHPLQGSIPAIKFIPLAENAGLILPIGDWVLAQTCRQLACWQKEYAFLPEVANLVISINVSNMQITEQNYVKKLDRILLETGINPSCLRLEITERMLQDPNINTQKTLLQIKQRNIKLSIDDFGTGYSSLSYLHRLPIDNLKIDRSLTNKIHCDRESQEIVNTIITLADSLQIKAIAEGVETKEQLQKLQALGCKYAQGYYFAEPLNLKSVKSFLEKNFAAQEQSLGIQPN